MDTIMSLPKTETTPPSPEALSERKADLKEFVDSELQRYTSEIYPLLEVRHELFTVNGTDYSPDLPIADQLYDHPTNNVDFINHDLGLRNGNALDYHQTTEKYDRGLSEEHAERVHEVAENDETTVDIAAPQDVVDEVVKTYKQLVQMSAELQ